MARSHLRYTVTDRAGNAIQNATVTAYLAGSSTLVADLYTLASGGSPVSTLISNNQGEVEGWLDTPKTVDLQVSDTTHTAYYSGAVGTLLTWSPFTETVEVTPPPENMGLLDGSQGWTGANTWSGAASFSGATTVSDKTATTNVALRPTAATGVFYVAADGSDSNDGTTWGTAKLTFAAARTAAIAAGGGTIELGIGTFNSTSPITPAANISVRGRHKLLTTLNYTGVAFAVDNNGTGAVLRMNISDLTIQANSPALGTVRMNDQGGTDFFYFTNVFFKGYSTSAGIGVLFTGQTGCVCHNRFVGCEWSNFKSCVVFSGFANGNKFDNCWMGTCGTAWDFRIATALEGGTGTDTLAGTDNLIERCEINGGTTVAINMAAGATRNEFNKVVADGPTTSLVHTSTGINYFFGCSLPNSTWPAAAGTVVAVGSDIGQTNGSATFTLRDTNLYRSATKQATFQGAWIVAKPSGASGYGVDVQDDSGSTMRIFSSSASSDGRASVVYQADRSSSYSWEAGVNPGGGTTKAFAIRDITGGRTPLSIDTSGHFTLNDGSNYILGTGTGTKWGTATTQKQAWFNATPIVQPAAGTDIYSALQNLGLHGGGTSPLNLGTGALTAGTGTFSGNVQAGPTTAVGRVHASASGANANIFATRSDGTADQRTTAISEQGGLTVIGRATDAGTVTAFIGLRQNGTIGIGSTASIGASTIAIGDGYNFNLGTSTGTKIGTATTEKLAFHNATPVIQRAGAAQAAVVTTASTNVTPFGFSTAAQADAIVTLVNELRAAAVEKGLIKGSA